MNDNIIGCKNTESFSTGMDFGYSFRPEQIMYCKECDKNKAIRTECAHFMYQYNRTFIYNKKGENMENNTQVNMDDDSEISSLSEIIAETIDQQKTIESVIESTEPVAEITTEYAFTVDSKGNLKPEFKGIIHRDITRGFSLLRGEKAIHKLMHGDLMELIRLSQEALNNTPELPEKLKPKEK